MLRKAFTMKVHPERVAEYTRRHNPIWPELAEVLRDHGVSDYSIHLDPDTNLLFGYARIESEEGWAAIADTEVCRRWWASMAELMETNADGSPKSQDLREVFYLE